MSQIATQPTLREVNIESRRQRILEAARSLIAGGGMQSLSMRKLAAESGLAVATLYNLYGSRDEILFALIQDGVDRTQGVCACEDHGAKQWRSKCDLHWPFRHQESRQECEKAKREKAKLDASLLDVVKTVNKHHQHGEHHPVADIRRWRVWTG